MGTPETPSEEQLAKAKTADAALLSLSPGENIAAFLTKVNFGSNPNDGSEQVNPLLKMKQVGDYTLAGAESTLTTYTLARTAVALAKGEAVGRVVNILTGAGDTAETVLDAISPIVYFILFILLSIGFTLSIFLAFIPFIYWLTACASWMASVLIGTTAGSLWAWTHIGGEEDKGSRAVYGYIYLVDAAIRPSLMVFGFFFSSLVIAAIGTLLNELIAPAIANVQANSITGIASVLGILMIYARLCTTLASTVFSLQVYMPDYVIAWLGGKEAAQLMNGAVDSAKNMFIGFGSGVQGTPRGKQMMDSTKPDTNQDGFK